MSLATPSDVMPDGRPTVAVVGIGAVTGYGWGRKLLREGLYMSRPAARRQDDAGGPANDDLWVAAVDDAGDPADGAGLAARATRFAAREAVGDAHDRGWRPGLLVALVHDVGLCPAPAGAKGPGAASTDAEVPGAIMEEFGFRGPVMAVGAGAATGPAAMLTARWWIAAGLADDVLVVTSDLSGRARAGTVADPGEAAMALMLSGRPDAAYARVLGGGLTYGPGAGSRLRRALTMAVADARLQAADIAYLNASGPSGPTDAEAAIADEMLTSMAGVFSVKSLVGDCGEAAGTVELAASLFGSDTGVIPAPPRAGKSHRLLLDGLTAAAEGPVAKTASGPSGHHGALVIAGDA